MKLSDQKIKLLKEALPELYGLVLNITSLLEGDLSYLKNLSKEEIEKLEAKDPSSLNIDLKLAVIQSRASAIRDKLKQSIEKCKSSLELNSRAALSEILLSEEFNKNLTIDEKFNASAVAAAISKVKYE